MIEHIFIYGTLKPELAKGSIVKAVSKLKYVGDGFVNGLLFDIGEFPGIKLRSSSKKRVRGSVFKLPSDDSVISELDRYEEFYPSKPEKSLYNRKLTKVELENGQTLDAWIYEYLGKTSNSKLIPKGVYENASSN